MIERERERERGSVVFLRSILLNSNATIIRIYSVTCDRLGDTEHRLVLTLAALPIGNDTKLKDIVNCKPVFIFRNQVFWVVALCGWVIASRRFEGNVPPSSPRSRVHELTHNRAGEGQKFLQNFGTKLPNQTAQQR